MTWRGAALLLCGAVLVAAGAAVEALYVAGIAVLVGAALLIALDGRRAPGARAISARREHDAMFSVGRPNAVAVQLRTVRAVDASVHDDCEAVPASNTRWRAHLPATLQYAVTPQARGVLQFGETVVRAEGPWRLGWRQSEVLAGESVPVEADIASVRVYDALARRGQLAEIGVRTLRMRTEGTEFERVREAVPDDPLRSINWKATARSGRLMATELMPERAQPVVVCIDHGRLMGIGAGELTKLDHAINAALLLVHVALHSGDRAGLVCFADTVTATLPPRSGAAQLRSFLDTVRPIRAIETEPDYDVVFAHLSRMQRRRALVVIFTDLADSGQATALMQRCAQLRRRHLPLVVTVRDPAVVDAARRLPSEQGDAYVRAVAGGLVADRSDALRLLGRGGIDTIDADARTLSPRVVNRYLELKRQLRI